MVTGILREPDLLNDCQFDILIAKDFGATLVYHEAEKYRDEMKESHVLTTL
jgi:hypothetical protein